ncbi:uncharacterized protein MONBRDRAFT_32424 [Monosiga brevicollis MX1]|uniref:Guanine nucleotide-binding protein subunit beta-like protein n=1 Tax=Monosiga brevicollis TaxID=81824 RepID=A9UZF9_MONBE|nr:uncharacterized protein MONBRDRAFT_32424 [Monosiga brevicollis MX1]EDQ89361.1 predicted protein [Monosiga brevicollis MX1]|eukprot:XP_001745937.1 hypothetical protein [Monosiga brevicollis MX1]
MPRLQYDMVTGGHDGLVKFWDVRSLARPVYQMRQHSHWHVFGEFFFLDFLTQATLALMKMSERTTSARYNPFHERLVLTSGTDGRVLLTNAPIISSALSYERGESDDSELTEGQRQARHMLSKPGTVAIYEEHEDSVSALTWHRGDAWTFASLSCDGRLSICRVPDDIKFSILL